MGLKLNTASGGSVSIEPTNTANNYTLTVPAQTGTVIASDASGNVGIGTSSPQVQLQVNASGTNSLLKLSGSSSGSGLNDGLDVGINTLDAIVWNREAGSLQFATSNSERMRIDSSGNLLVGTTTSTDQRVRFYTDASGPVWCLKVQNGRTSGTLNMIEFLTGTGPTVAGSITSSGSSTTYATSSDYRLKENIAPMTGALATVAQLKPVTYTWKADGAQGQGFIAHELQEVVPDAVVGEKDAVNEDGSIKPQGIDTSFLVATLTAAIQELKAQLDESNLILTSVKTELDTVKTELATLKGTA